MGHVGEAQVPIRVGFDGAHEGVGDADGDVEVGDGVLIGLAGDEIFHVGVVDAQDAHVGAAAGAALGDLAEGVVVDAQETDRAGGLTGGGFDDGALGAQAREGEAVAAAGLLDEGGVAQGLEDAGGVAAHVVDDGQDEAGGQLAEGGAGAGEGGGVGEEFFGGEEMVESAGAFEDGGLPGFFDRGDIVGHPPEHVFDRSRPVCHPRRGARSGVMRTWRALSVSSTGGRSAGRGWDGDQAGLSGLVAVHFSFFLYHCCSPRL